MYKLLLVDDEPEVTEGLEEEVAWSEIRIQEVNSAMNGKEAMDMIEKYEPDIVVTDISMPFMNGLQLTEWIKEHYPLTKVIIISGYDDFQYAKQAIQYQVVEYLLKPFSNEQFIETIQRAVMKMDDEREAISNMKNLEEHYRVTLPMIREKFLASLMTRSLPQSLIEQRAAKYEFDLKAKGYIVSLISILYHDTNTEDITVNEHGSLVNSFDYDLKLFAISNIATELCYSEKLGHVFIYQDEVVLLSMDQSGNQAAAMEQTLSSLRKILHSIDRYLRISTVISVGTYTRELQHMKHAYESARSGLDYRRMMEHNTIICIDDMEKAIPSTFIFDEVKEQQLMRSIKLGSKEELQQALDQIFDEVQQSHASISEYEQYFLECITAIHRLMKTLQLNTDVVLREGTSLLKQYQKLQSLEETRNWFIEICFHIHHVIASSRQVTSAKLVDEAIQYTKDHYMDNDLSIATLCQRLHISPGYFSGVFKKATQLTYGAYLLNVRMEIAQELLSTTDLKAFEIGERVGFADANYFSLSFKKYMGVSAKEYRSGLHRKG